MPRWFQAATRSVSDTWRRQDLGWVLTGRAESPERRGGLGLDLGLHSTGLLGVTSYVVWKPEGGVPKS